MWQQAFSLSSTPGSHLGILSLYKFQVQRYLGWGRGQKLNYKVTKWDKELSPWDAVHVKHKPTALNTTCPHPGSLLINRSQGHMPARKYTPGYANSQQKFRERVQAGMTPRNRIQAHAGKKPNLRLTELMGLGPGEREVQGQLTQPCCKAGIALRGWKSDH